MVTGFMMLAANFVIVIYIIHKTEHFACFFDLICFVWIITDGSHISRLSGVKQESHDLKSGFESSINQVKVSIDGKFSEINLQLKDIKESFASTVNDIVTTVYLRWKTIIEVLKEENIKLQKKPWKPWS